MSPPTVDIMKKVDLAVRPQAASREASPLEERVDFIFGVASRGLSPFECELSGKPVGHRLEVPLAGTSFHAYFETLAPVLLHRFPGLLEGAFASIRFRVDGVADADRRDIIRAMAASTEGCSGGDCGCGCH